MKTVKFLTHFSNKVSPDYALEKLTEKFGIKVNRYSDRVVLNYCQINSYKFAPIVKECRGLILSYPDFEVLSRSFDRFFNYREDKRELNFPFHDAIAYEKCDGSLISLYHDSSKWCISSKGTAFAEAEMPTGRTLNELFSSTLRENSEYVDLTLPEDLKTFWDFTFIFELCAPDNRVVKSYGAKTKIFFIGMRHKHTGEYYKPEDFIHLFQEYGIELPEVFDINSFEEAVEYYEKLDTLDEGWVFYHEETGKRVKVKNPSYVQIHHLRDNGALNPKRIINLILLNETSEYLTYFPEDEEFFLPYINAYNTLLSKIEESWMKHKDIPEQKEFALTVREYPYSGFLFTARQGYLNFTEYDFKEMLNSMSENNRVELLGQFIENQK